MITTNFPVDREDRKLGSHDMLNDADGITHREDLWGRLEVRRVPADKKWADADAFARYHSSRHM